MSNNCKSNKLPISIVLLICLVLRGNTHRLTHRPSPGENADGLKDRKYVTQVVDGKRHKYESVTIDGEALALYQGDIIIGSNISNVSNITMDIDRNIRRLSPIYVNADKYWPGGYIPYEVNRDTGLDVFSEALWVGRLSKAISHWNDNTDITLSVRDGETDYIEFVGYERGYCASYIGRQGGKQPIYIDYWVCSEGSTIHEIGHSVGLFHTQSRDDRDQYVTIDESQIADADEVHNFEKAGLNNDYGNYDYGSIMHYPANAFTAKSSDESILAKNYNGNLVSGSIGTTYIAGNAPFCNGQCDNSDSQLDTFKDNCWTGNKVRCVEMGQRDGLSDEDINCINYIYSTV